MAMNTNLLNALKEIVSKHGGAGTLSDARRVKALLADLAAGEPKPQKNALVACIELGFVPALQNVSPGERGAAKTKLADRLNREEGLDMALCADTLDLLEAALFGGVSPKVAPPGTAAPGKPAPQNAYYLSMNYQQTGPFSLEQLKGMIGGGQVSKEYWIRTGDRGDWKSVTAMPELKAFFGGTGKNDGAKLETAAPNRQTAAPNLTAASKKPASKRQLAPVSPASQNKEVWRELRTLWDIGGINALAPDCRKIVSVAYKAIKVWDVETGLEIQTLTGHKKEVDCVAYSPDGRRIVSGSYDKTVRIWDAESGLEIQTLKGHRDRVVSVVYSPDGRRIASREWNGTIKIWDAESGHELYTIIKEGWIEYSPDGRRILSSSGGIWDAESGRKLYTLNGEFSSFVVYCPDGRRIASSLEDSAIQIWDAGNGRKLHTLKGDYDERSSLVFSPDGRRIAAGSDNHIQIWDAESGRELNDLYCHYDGDYDDDRYVDCVAYSPDGCRIASASSGADNTTIQIWDAERGREIQTLEGQGKGIYFITYSSDGRRIVSMSKAAFERNHVITIWDRED